MLARASAAGEQPAPSGKVSQSSSADALPAGALKSSPSLYLKEAASSEIRWQPWSPQAFALARSLNRPVLIDIGAVWCHWCHVMDETTYADPEIAAMLNANFVPVKVDSDERPDIDGYYQNAAAHLTGAGGWPLTCFATSSGALFFAAGYLPPRPGSGPDGSGGENSSMMPLLRRIVAVYANDRAEMESVADATAAKLRAVSTTPSAPAAGSLDAMRARILAGLATSYNRETGGFASGAGPRFYDFPALELALAHGFFGHPEFTAMALDTLRKIAAAGVFDQLGGGFHRYSTDANWGVPHFEKMAYDNAMALQVYCDAYAASGDEEFAQVARSIAAYVNRELLDPATHTFYSHQDDGSYYTWTAQELKHAVSPDESRAAILLFGIQDGPPRMPDGRIVLRRARNANQIAALLMISPAEARNLISKIDAALLAARARRKPPQVDRAVLTDRNALMCDAYLTAASVLKDPGLQRTALDDLDFILGHLQTHDGSFFHVWSEGHAQVGGLAADQVYLLNALIDAYQFSGEQKYLGSARALSAVILDKFRAPATGLLTNCDSGDASVVNAASANSAQVFYDMPSPSVQATMAIAEAKLGLVTGDETYAKTATELLARAPAMAGSTMSSNVATVGTALEYRTNGYATVAIIGGPSAGRVDALTNTALATYRPGKTVIRVSSDAGAIATLPPAVRAMLEASRGKNSELAFVCAGTACATPVDNAAKLASVITRFGVGPSAKTAVANEKSGASATP
jgi:uncharacterized protein YyaL (SSP411 family)